MTWSFSDAAPVSEANQVRILVQDVDTTDQLISDESIAVYLTGGALAQSDVYQSAAAVAGLIATKFARMAKSVGAGGSRVEWADRAAFYRELQDVLLAGPPTNNRSAAPYAGGISRADVIARESDTDRVVPAFDRDPFRPTPDRESYWR